MNGPGQCGQRPGFPSTGRRRRSRLALGAAIVAALAGCRAPATRPVPQERAPALAAAPPVGEPYDWHDLVIAPFGSVLKDVPIVLHEVLLFRDESRGDAAVDDAECYGADPPAPRFLGRAPDEYLLCFKQDRLSRIEASVHLTAAEASDVFAAACAAWFRHAAAEAPAASEAGAACEGRDGAIRFSARLAEEPIREDTAETHTLLSLTLDSVPGP
ncbi:MAG TPA: hypothetical protein VNW26_02405 [Steroidobacteraceae bacterium]|nr:hypothetical protein [Steroidobacteraceae bacterium]